jgi:hypothetical protein
MSQAASPVNTENPSKTYEVHARKGEFKSEKRAVEALKGVSPEVNREKFLASTVDALNASLQR